MPDSNLLFGRPLVLSAAKVRGNNKTELFSRSGRKGWSARGGNQGQSPANRGFRAPAGCQQRRSWTKTAYGHPEATLKPPSGYLVANR